MNNWIKKYDDNYADDSFLDNDNQMEDGCICTSCVSYKSNERCIICEKGDLYEPEPYN
jgi:hypothetical protein